MSTKYCGPNLLTKALREKLLKAGADNMNPICKLFSPYGGQTWLLTGAEALDQEDCKVPNDILLFGYADLGMQCVEWGPLETLHDMSSIKKFGTVPAIERDAFWDPMSEKWLEGGTKAGALEPDAILALDSLAGY